MTVEVVPTAHPVGAEIRGVDVGAGIDEPTFRQIANALYQYGMVFLRGQRISELQHVAFSRRLGSLKKPRDETQFLMRGYPDLTVLSNIVEHGEPIGLVEAGQYWHTDRCYTPAPNAHAVLYALEIPHDDSGRPLGDTQFASAVSAYELLPDAVKGRLEGRRATHDYNNPFRTKDPAYKAASDQLPPVDHPAVRTHPATGRKCLYVNRQYTTKISGLSEAESRELIQYLTDFMVRDGAVYRHQWQVGDFLMWDDCLVQHCAIGDYKLPQRRLLRRTTVVGSAPF
jgi:taurine dioxygenase